MAGQSTDELEQIVMTESFHSQKQVLLEICEALMDQLKSIMALPDFTDRHFVQWEAACKSIRRQLSEEILRIAVVGPIKSGKSTFVNALLKGDYLKRGAGVVTSFVTRVREGQDLKAVLCFKTWEEINADIAQALTILPAWHRPMESEPFDIRRKKDRSELAEALNSLPVEKQISQNTRNLNSVLLTSYLKGFEQIKAMEFRENMTIEYGAARFNEHRAFSGDEILAVYLKDIQLEINTDNRLQNIELADCQGSDSPNPLHLALIQDYLLTAHLLIYVISSRTGLRQADIRFLSMIKKMGIMDNIMFIVNCDFSEHENLAGLEVLIGKIKEELALIKPEHDLFVFSSLFNLFSIGPDKLARKDRLRWEQWKEEQTFVAFSDQETGRFVKRLESKLIGERYTLLLKNHLERLRRITSNLSHWSAMRKDILSGDKNRAEGILQSLKAHQQKTDQLAGMMKKTLDGAAQQIKNNIRKNVDRYFDTRNSQIVGDVNRFIRSFRADFSAYEEDKTPAGFNQALYLAFQDFKQALDTYMAQTVNPGIIGFLREEEKNIHAAFEDVGRPFAGMVEDALVQYEKLVSGFGIPVQQADRSRFCMADLEAVKALAGLKVPPATAMMRYSARVKTEAFVRLGCYSLINLFRRILKKTGPGRGQDAHQALEDGIRRLKMETEQAVLFNFKNYKENIKFQYLFKLVDTAAIALFQQMTERFEACLMDLSALTGLLTEKRIDKERIYRLLEEISLSAEALSKKIIHLESKLTRMMN